MTHTSCYGVSKRARIKLNTMLQLDSAQEAVATTRAVEEDRRLFIQVNARVIQECLCLTLICDAVRLRLCVL
jgi:hypothetical protein